MNDMLITKHRKSGLNYLLLLFTYCIVCFSVFIYIFFFTNEEVPLVPILLFLVAGCFFGYLLLKSEPVIEIDLQSGNVLERFPMSLTKFSYNKTEIIGYNLSSQMYFTKHPFNSTYISIELYYHTTDDNVHSITSLTVRNFEEFLEYFYNTYPMVSDKKFKPYTEEKKVEQHKSILNQIEEDKRDFWKKKKKDLLVFVLIAAGVILLRVLMWKYL